MVAMEQDAATKVTQTRAQALAALTAVAIAFPAVLLMRGEGGPWFARVITLVETLIFAGWAPLLYLIASAGYGRLIRRWIPKRTGRWCIELGFGLTVLLSLTHITGMLGFLTSISAWVITGIGIALFLPVHKELKGSFSTERVTLIHIVIVCGLMLALVMACNPPGILWGSEYGGFDALSYHLQLPREWIEHGRIWPSDHNVYSFLPSYMEGAYAHIALMMGDGMHADNGQALISTQLLSAFMLILAAGSIGELARLTCDRIVPDADARLAGRIGMALAFGTPWLIVVGTLAYNEIAVVLLGSAALIVAMRADIETWKRAVLCGLIVGGACSCKPTALFMLAPSVGIVLLACSPKKHWIVMSMVCVVVGSLTIAPWLIRNELATGNPVFPQLHGIFHDGHWNETQHAIYASAHAFGGSILDRFMMLVVPDANGIDHVSRFRGFTNGQWGLIPALGVFGALGLLFTMKTHRAGFVALLALGGPIIAWAMLTHLQSRFLIPLAPTLIVLGSVLIVRIPNRPAREAVAKITCISVLMWSIGHALVQNRGNPFVLFDLGPGYALGEYEMQQLPWTAALNRLAGEDDTIYLLGDATPIYIRGDVRYNTVYDDWMIAEAIESNPNDPKAWTQHLRNRGVDLVVVAFSEIERYARSEWLPDPVDPDRLIVWIDSLGSPIQVWSDPQTQIPIRAIFRITPDTPTP